MLLCAPVFCKPAPRLFSSHEQQLTHSRTPFASALLQGYAINPARDFGPRFFTFIAGWGSEVFTVYDNYFLVPLLAPMMGGPIGAFVYYIFIERHHPSPEQ